MSGDGYLLRLDVVGDLVKVAVATPGLAAGAWVDVDLEQLLNALDPGRIL